MGDVKLAARLVVLGLAGGCGRVAFDPSNGGGADAARGATDSYSEAVLAARPVAYWRLAERAGTIAHDETGTYPGTYTGGCTLGATGALTSADPAVALDGTSCRIEIGDVLEFAGAAPFTIELWANLAVSDSSVRWLVSHNTPSGPKSGYSLSILDAKLWFEQDSADTSLAYVSTALPSLGVFHHLALTTNTTRQRIYVDGAMVTEQPFVTSEPAGTGLLTFGDYLQPDPNKLQGTLDEIAFYDRELDAATIAAHVAAR